MQKTVKEWLEECTEPWAAKALKNYQEQGEVASGFEVDLLTKALVCAFNWSQTNEGYDFWYNIYYDLHEKNLMKKTIGRK